MKTETVYDIVRELSSEPLAENGAKPWLHYLADRIDAAHTREIAEKDAEIARLRECLREAVEWSCGNPDESCEDCVAHGGDTPCKCEKWRNALKGGMK